jgi:hypothetical protein
VACARAVLRLGGSNSSGNILLHASNRSKGVTAEAEQPRINLAIEACATQTSGLQLGHCKLEVQRSREYNACCLELFASIMLRQDMTIFWDPINILHRLRSTN